MKKYFPKVLIVSIDPFNKSDGTGITLSNLFEGWDKNSIAQIYIADKPISNDICDRYYRLKPQFAFFDFYFRKLISFFYKSEIGNVGAPAGVALGEKNRNLKSQIHLNIRAIMDFSPFFIHRDVFKWIDEFNPDIIYCTLGSARMINLTNKIVSRIGKPIVPHFMDDWPTTLYSQNELGGLAKIKFEKNFKRLLSNSNGGLCISEQMAKEYQKRYELSFEPFVNCVEDTLFYKPRENDFSGGMLVLMYVGGLHLNRWQSILDISKAVEKLSKMNNSIVLKIYCPLKDIELYSYHFTKYTNTRFEGSLSSNGVSVALQNATVLLHVESFDQNYTEYTKFSLSTKIPQYMAAGKPILGYGPNILASIQHIEKSNSGKIVVERDLERLVEVIGGFIVNNVSLFKYALDGFNYARNFHSKSYNGMRLREVLTEYLSRSNS